MRVEGPLYVCGHSTGELDRLAAQDAVFREITDDVLARAGIGSGMSVLEVGCGGGDFSLCVARNVGPAGRVIGIDRAPEAIAVARRRAQDEPGVRVAFHVAEISAFDSGEPVDAVVGRFVLMHQTDPAGTLRAAARHVRSGGLVLMMESNLTGARPGSRAWPEPPLFGAVIDWMTELIGQAGALPDMGMRLHRTFRDAGLPAPRLRQHAALFSGPAAAALCAYLAASVRSMLPVALRLRFPTPTYLAADTLARDLSEEARSLDAVLSSPPLIAATSCCDRAGETASPEPVAHPEMPRHSPQMPTTSTR